MWKWIILGYLSVCIHIDVFGDLNILYFLKLINLLALNNTHLKYLWYSFFNVINKSGKLSAVMVMVPKVAKAISSTQNILQALKIVEFKNRKKISPPRALCSEMSNFFL